MKLINREPTPEIIAALHTADANHKYGGDWHEEVYAALYDAAPEADVQAEIDKREARIAELEEDKATLVRNCNQSGYDPQGGGLRPRQCAPSARPRRAAARVRAQERIPLD